LVFFVLDCRYP